MQKRYGLVMVTFLIIFSLAFASCSKPPMETIAMDVGACADMLLNTVSFQDILTAISDEMMATLYLIDEQDVTQSKVYVSSGATAEEIAVFEARDSDAARRIEAAVLQRVAEQQSSFRDYLPAELPKLDDPFVQVRGKYVILCLSNDNKKARTELDKFISQSSSQ
jgi:hypothetical protein